MHQEFQVSQFNLLIMCSNILNHKGLAKDNPGQVLSRPYC